MVIITGCARWPDGPGPGPGTEYQLEITVEVEGTIDSSNDGIYYIVMDTDGSSATGPDEDIDFWDNDFYCITLEDGYFDFFQVADEYAVPFDGGSINGNTIQVTIALSDLGDPNSIDINVVTTDPDNYTYDYLNSYFTINTTVLGATGEGVVSGEGTGGADFNITKASAMITTLY